MAREIADERAKLIYQTVVNTGLRRSELQALTWADIDLIENALRVRVSKSKSGRRTISLGPLLAEDFWQYRRKATYNNDGDFVFAHPTRGSKFCPEWYGREFRAACKAAGVEAPRRPLHDLRHSAITNYAAETGNSFAVQTMAGHKSLASIRPYLHLSGRVFPEEAAKLEARYGGDFVPAFVPTRADLSRPQPT